MQASRSTRLDAKITLASLAYVYYRTRCQWLIISCALNMESSQIASVDLGSKSFRVQVARVEGGRIYPLDSLKESVHLQSGLQADKTLSVDSQKCALRALARFSERLRGFSPQDVRAVATNTLRVAHDKSAFLSDAEAALGFPIEIIAGKEEARLIFQGAAHTLAPSSLRRLIIDVGGGSTEFIIGRRYTPLVLDSLRIGCVAWSDTFFKDGLYEKKRFRAAEIAAAREIETLLDDFNDHGWDEAIATSSSAKALVEILDENGFNPSGVGGDISREGMAALKSAMLKAGSEKSLKLNGLVEDRGSVLAGSLTVMSAIFDTLKLERMGYTDGSLRLGVLYDLCGRIEHANDPREESIRQLQQRYQVSQAQATRVEKLALAFFDQLEEAGVNGTARAFLAWAARVHEIGWAVSHASYHKHGAYILANADLPGFSKSEQDRLAMLVLGHRGKVLKLVKSELKPKRESWNALLALRLAILFNRGRGNAQLPQHFSLATSKNGYTLRLPADWLRAHPLSQANLDEESSMWRTVGIGLETVDQ